MLNVNRKDLSIIIPIDLSRRSKQIYKRAQVIATELGGAGFNVIFGINTLNTALSYQLLKVLTTIPNIKYNTINENNVPLAKIRNCAINLVDTKYTLFLDVDIYPDVHVLDEYLQLVNKAKNNICIIPCLYLTEKGKFFLSKNKSSEKIIESYFNCRRDIVNHLAFPTSLIILDTYSVKMINGFDENFIGHGYEDFDFMIRILNYKKLINLSGDLLVDESYSSVILMKGFRAVIATPMIEYLFGKKYLLHLHHYKDVNEFYYEQRVFNKDYFLQKYKYIVLNQEEINVYKLQKNEYSFLMNSLKFCNENSLDIDDFKVFFDMLPGHMWRNYSWKDFLRSRYKNYIKKFHDYAIMNKVLSKFFN